MSSENPHELQEMSLRSQKIGVWCAMSRNRIFITFFEQTVNSDRYVTMMEEFVNALPAEKNATDHTANTIRCLERVFQDLWPVRSPDLLTFLWGYLKDAVYVTHSHSFPELQTNIQNNVDAISQQTLKTVFSNMINPVHLCEEKNGGHFQHLM
ncbi:hypothetical protein ANN_21218 [Periplaneta americana]|uniref:Uncharacterized protein n=1 Tax=Periplaneta americana TaxID=6978 RepID=A0ABQ8SEU8_PERAM|nr:hypothetical protein ANN_21218 [Periplaneta americana]